MNRRLESLEKSSGEGDPGFPKRQWPPSELCPLCRLPALKKKADVTWQKSPDRYASSPIAERGFCARCGTSLTFEFPDSENMDLTVASFDDPARFRPEHHFGVESWHPVWLDTRDLPEYRADEHQPTIDRWMKTLGKLPD